MYFCACLYALGGNDTHRANGLASGEAVVQLDILTYIG